MIGASFISVFYAEIVTDEGEGNVVRVVSPELRCAGDGEVAVFGEVGSEPVVGEFTCLLEARHAFPYFNIYDAFDGDVLQFVFVYYFLGNQLEGELHVFVYFERGFVVEIFYV